MGSSEQEPLAQAIGLAAPQIGERVLDLSGRAGTIALHIATTAASVEAVQPDADLAAEGRRLAVAMGRGNVYFHAGPLHSLPFDRGQFDLVLCCLTLAQELRPVAALTEIQRVLRPEGRLVLQEVTAFAHSSLDLKIWELERRRNPRHLLYYTEEQLYALLGLGGLEATTEEHSSMTQDFDYWAATGRLSVEEAAMLKRVFFNLPLADQDRLDLALGDGRISFTYPVTTLLARVL
jgi:SAM-dependent methyltransferase